MELLPSGGKFLVGNGGVVEGFLADGQRQPSGEISFNEQFDVWRQLSPIFFHFLGVR